MHKLVILIHVPEHDQAFDLGWPEFLRNAEEMPGLRKESTSRVRFTIFGGQVITMIHELYFDTFPALELAMRSEPGKQAGEVLQRITGGRCTLLFADHHEDLISNFRTLKKAEQPEPEQPHGDA